MVRPEIAMCYAGPDLVESYLEDFSEEALFDILQDPGRLHDLTQDIVEHVREESGLVGPPGDLSGSDYSLDSPDVQQDGKSIGNYDFSSTTIPTDSEKSQRVLTPDGRSAKKQKKL